MGMFIMWIIFAIIVFVIFSFAIGANKKNVAKYSGRSTYESEFRRAQNNVELWKKMRIFIGLPLISFFLILAFISPSILSVSKDTAAHFTKRILGKTLSDGKIIALDGEMGPQADIKREGFYIDPFIHFIYDVDEKPIVSVAQGQVLTLVAKDGIPLEDSEYFAPNWRESVYAHAKNKLSGKLSEEDEKYYENVLKMHPDEIEKSMMDARFFLKNGGKKGPQYNVLKPGRYPINTFLFDYKVEKSTVIDPGEVGVVTSRYGHQCEKVISTATGELAAPLVDKGCIGVWKDTLTTGNYYFNPYAVKVNKLPTRVQAWIYQGGYTPREVDVSIGDDGRIIQKPLNFKERVVPKHAADSAIQVKTKDKWRVFVEVRMQVQPEPKYASAIYASVGGLEQIENKGITPALQSVLRNMGEIHKSEDFIITRSKIEAEVEAQMIKEGRKYGVSIKEVRFGHIDVEPATMTPGKIKQLSSDLESAYIQQQQTFNELIKTNEIKATADQQPELVKAKIENDRADYQAKAREKAGIGEEKVLKAFARGQEAQKAVLGSDKTYQLQVIKTMAELCKVKPEVCSNVPVIYSAGSGGTDSKMLESFGALGLQNIIKAGEAIGKGTKGNGK